MAPKITLYVDTVSPFAYMAYYILRHDPTFSKCEITYVPIFLGGVMKAVGNTPPINIKNKDTWTERERLRYTNLFNIPMNPKFPPDFPPLTLPNMRALCALTAISPSSPQNQHQTHLTTALDALYHAYWVQHRQTHKPEILAEVLRETFSNEKTSGGESLVDRITEMMGKEGKEILARNTDAAIKDGAFGLPWFLCEDEKGRKEGFWGVDHLGFVVEFLGLERRGGKEWKSLL